MDSRGAWRRFSFKNVAFLDNLVSYKFGAFWGEHVLLSTARPFLYFAINMAIECARTVKYGEESTQVFQLINEIGWKEYKYSVRCFVCVFNTGAFCR